jgi:hypothetical protein
MKDLIGRNTILKGTGKTFPVHAMKAYRRRSTAPPILKLGPRRR